jgi:hypothetical protein
MFVVIRLFCDMLQSAVQRKKVYFGEVKASADIDHSPGDSNPCRQGL